ncbi:MAG: hypothetical protein WCI11_21055 [Candidatus Methylumidiphilus sp.]
MNTPAKKIKKQANYPPPRNSQQTLFADVTHQRGVLVPKLQLQSH